MLPEEKQRKRIIDYLNSLPYTKAIILDNPMTRGCPDIIGSILGLCIVIEVKLDNYTPKRKGHKLQTKTLEEWSGTLMPAMLVKMPSDFEGLKKRINELHRDLSEMKAKTLGVEKIALNTN